MMEDIHIKLEPRDQEMILRDELFEMSHISVKIETKNEDEKGGIPGPVYITTKEEPVTSNSLDVVKKSEPLGQDRLTDTGDSGIGDANMVTDRPYPMTLYWIDSRVKSDNGSTNHRVKAGNQCETMIPKRLESEEQSPQWALNRSNSDCGESPVKLGRNEIIKIQQPYKCSVCPYSCSRRGDLERHAGKHFFTLKSSRPLSTCLEKGNLRMQNRTHTAVKAFKCSRCPYTCKRSSSLKTHELIHTGEKPYKCHLCPYTCKVKSDLKRHECRHTGQKPYKCSRCPYTCSLNCSLKAHGLKAHGLIRTGETPYTCSLCPYTCKREGNLKMHELTHTDERPYKCSLCPSTCKHKNWLTPSGVKPHKY